MSAWLALALGAGLTLVLAGGAAAPPGDIEKYYPIHEHAVRWYAIKDVETGRTRDYTSFAVVARQRTEDGRLVYVVENRHAGGVGLDYEEVTPAQVRVHRVLAARPDGTLAEAVFTPPLARLRAPLEPGRSWRETPEHDTAYVYTVAARVALSVRGARVPDCVRVARARGGRVDSRTDYCPGIGVAGFETLTPAGTWLRADLMEPAGELDLVAVRASGRGCEYILEPLAFPDAEELTVTVTPPGLEAETIRQASARMLQVGLAPDAGHGRRLVRVQGRQRVARYVITWTGRCRAAFLAPPPQGPSVSLVAQEAQPGRVTVTVAGSGWTPAEPLTLTTAGAGWQTEVSPLGRADAGGRSNPAVLPIGDNLARGEYTFTLRGAARAATLTLLCPDEGFCRVKSWRAP